MRDQHIKTDILTPDYILLKQKSITYKKSLQSTLAGEAQEIEHRPENQRVRFPVRAHAWVAGQVPSRGHVRGSHTFIFLSLSFSLPSPSLKIDK